MKQSLFNKLDLFCLKYNIKFLLFEFLKFLSILSILIDINK